RPRVRTSSDFWTTMTRSASLVAAVHEARKDQTEEPVRAAEGPAEMLAAAAAHGDAPAAAGKPGVLGGGAAQRGAAGGGAEAAEGVLDARGVHAHVHVTAGNGDPFRVLRDGMTAGPAAKARAATRVRGLCMTADALVYAAGSRVEPQDGTRGAGRPAACRGAARGNPGAGGGGTQPPREARDEGTAGDHGQ